MTAEPAPEETLDPEDWGALRALGHRMVDDMMDHLATVRERPVWQPVSAAARAEIQAAYPLSPTDPAEVYEQFRRSILPFPTGNTHPRFWGWVMGTGSPLAMLADLLASGMNAHVAGYDQSAAVVEGQVVGWMKQALGFPAAATGLMTGGGTLANLIGLAVARQAKAGFDVRAQGNYGGPRLRVYASTETHGWVQRAVELLGLGGASLCRVPVDGDFRLRLDLLEEAIREDRARGFCPFAIIGTAGTVNTGATDDLPGLRRIADREGLWFHVDGAFGALAALSPEHRHRVAGIESADSLAIDLHKWMYLPFEAGMALVRDGVRHRETFTLGPAYLATLERGILTEPLTFAGLGLDLSRGFRALKAWISFKAHGMEKFGRLIGQNIEQAAYLERRLAADPRFELLAPVPLNVVVFRFRPRGAGEADLDRLNREILMRLQETGTAIPSSTVIHGRFGLRVAITNHRSRREDFDVLVEAAARFGQEALKAATAVAA